MDSIKDFLDNTLIFDTDIISEITYTDKSTTIIESIDIKKVDSKIVRLKNIQTFELKKFVCDKSEIKTLIEKEVFDVIKSSTQTTSIDYFPKGLFKFLKRNKEENLLSRVKLEDDTWSLSSERTSRVLSKVETLKNLIDDSLNNQVFIGNSNSISAIINTNYKDESTTIEFELLIYNKNIRKILIE